MARNSVGDLATPDYNKWKLHEDGTSGLDENNEKQHKLTSLSVFMIFFIWLMWGLSIIYMLVILMNLLISIISVAFETVQERSNIVKYKQRVQAIYYSTIINKNLKANALIRKALAL
jgi:hypothetical protein